MTLRRTPALLLPALLVVTACGGPPTDDVTNWRVRADFDPAVSDEAIELNEDGGWLAAAGTAATVEVDTRFRIRFEVQRADTGAVNYRLESRRGAAAWEPVEALDHPYPDEIASPVTSIVATEGFVHGEPSGDLLAGDTGPFVGGSGVALRTSPFIRPLPTGSTEWEWPLVIRHFADGAEQVVAGETFEYRMVGGDGTPLGGAVASVTSSVPEGHLGGTYVETPDRIGPFEASNGDLYFVQEPAETDNVFMVVKSADRGRSWTEVDGAGRPPNGDLEAVSAVQVGDVIHMVHMGDRTWHYSFNTSDHPSAPDRWALNDEEVAPERDPPTQVTAMSARSDGSLVAVYGGDTKLHYRIRSSDGAWGPEGTIDATTPDVLSGPVTVTGEGDVVHLAYVDHQGRGWVRSVLPDGSLTTRTRFATGLGTDEVDRVSILPLSRLASGAVSIVYRPEDGRLLERTLSPTGALGSPAVVTSVRVASGPVDSDQATADVIAVGVDLHVLFVEEATGSLWHVARRGSAGWGTPALVMDGIEGQWVRGALLEGGPDGPVYGFVVDTGSEGGSGMNRYGEVALGG